MFLRKAVVAILISDKVILQQRKLPRITRQQHGNCQREKWMRGGGRAEWG